MWSHSTARSLAACMHRLHTLLNAGLHKAAFQHAVPEYLPHARPLHVCVHTFVEVNVLWGTQDNAIVSKVADPQLSRRR